MKAFAYLRTSSASNVGADKDSDTRQRLAITAYAASAGIAIEAEFYDAAVSGADPILSRPGFADMLATIQSNGVRTIIVENASRFARDLIVQETGYQSLKAQGITIIAADDPDAFQNDTPTGNLIRQILGAVAEFEKANLVAKLRGARERKRRTAGRCEGPKPAPDAARILARTLHKEGKSLRAISAQLALEGHYAPSGAVYGPESIKRML